jgi:hypothetical protein
MKKVEMGEARRDWLLGLQAGDHVCRLLGGEVPMELTVREIKGDLLVCGREGFVWTFDRATGAEVDEEIGWGPRFGRTGSFLVPPEHVYQ